MSFTEFCTGDLLLFKGNWWISRLIEYFSGGKYSHAGILIRNPRQIGIDLEDGDYILHSSWGKSSETGESIYGVHIENLQDVLSQYPQGAVDIRIVHAARNPYFYHKLKGIHERVHHKSYDMNLYDWLLAASGKKPYGLPKWYRITSRFWCSALVSYVYDELGWIDDIDWTLVSPSELSESGICIRWKVPVESSKPFEYQNL